MAAMQQYAERVAEFMQKYTNRTFRPKVGDEVVLARVNMALFEVHRHVVLVTEQIGRDHFEVESRFRKRFVEPVTSLFPQGTRFL